MKSRVIESHKKEKIEIFNKRLGVIFNGDDNLKPLIIESLIDHSATALLCSDMYSSFVTGGGFAIGSPLIGITDENMRQIKLNDLLLDVGAVLSRHKGVFIHVRYNALYEKESFKIIPYSLCRVGRKDSEGYSGKVVVSDKGWGRSLKKEDLKVFDVYNPNPAVIQEQVDRDGGWENYAGQIMFFKLNSKHTYPKSFIETAYTFADTEWQMGLFYNSTAKKGFEDITIIRHRAFPNDDDKRAFDANIKKITGLENAGSVLLTEDEWDDEREKSGNFKFDTLKNDSKPDKFKHFEESSANYIRKAYKIPAQLVDFTQGKLGNSGGKDLIVAQSIYNVLTANDRLKVSYLFAELFTNYKININPSGDWSIKQFSLLKDGTAN